MENSNHTGVEYPTLELGGKTYTLKVTRGALLFRLSKMGVDLAGVTQERNFYRTIEILHAIIGPEIMLTAEGIADLVMSEGKLGEVSQAVAEAVKKVFPPLQTTQAAEPAGEAAPALD